MITFSNLGKLGRLGNQLFQMSAVIGHSINTGVPYGFPFWNYNRYLKTPLESNDIQERVNMFREIDPWGFIEIPKCDKLDLYGYFQNPQYFDSHRDKILEIFEPNEEINKNLEDYFSQYEGKRITAIHVRRGDYLNFPDHHPVPSMEYYSKAIKILNSETEVFMVFSDDIDWCKEKFVGNFVFSEDTDEFIDLMKMTRCDNYIIANSSFSWWGSYLCKKRNKTIAPSQWVGNGYRNKKWQQVYRKDMIIL